MKITAHQLAAMLLAGPDLPVFIDSDGETESVLTSVGDNELQLGTSRHIGSASKNPQIVVLSRDTSEWAWSYDYAYKRIKLGGT